MASVSVKYGLTELKKYNHLRFYTTTDMTGIYTSTWKSLDEKQIKQSNTVARDLPPTGSEANTTIFLYIYWI